jgi:hypothetical protein
LQGSSESTDGPINRFYLLFHSFYLNGFLENLLASHGWGHSFSSPIKKSQELTRTSGTCDIMDISFGMLPEIKVSSEFHGRSAADGSLGEAVPIAGDLGDQQAASAE